MMNLNEAKILSEQLDKAIEELAQITDNLEKNRDMVFPIYRLLTLKRGVDKAIKVEEVIDHEQTVRKAIRNLYQ